ncbi:MAG: WG repeat-containing protein [Bacteroidota bacterium]|nr:WG repeat-containing protein [Bacteroidota bacterium]
MKTQRESEELKMTGFQQFPVALYPVQIKEKWGYMNRRGDIIITPQFDIAEDFYDGIAKAGILTGDHLVYGFIDTKGQWVIQPQYHRCGLFSEGMCAVENDEKFGFINNGGQVVIPLQFKDAGMFTEGLAAVKQNGWTRFIDKSGTIVFDKKYTCSVRYPRFVDGRAPVFGPDEKTGFIDSTGNFVIENKFESASPFKEDKAWAMLEIRDKTAADTLTIKGGFINISGQFLIMPQYDFGWDFCEGYATVWTRSEDKKQKIWKVIDAKGDVVLDDLLYVTVGSLNEGFIPVQNAELKWGFINIKGEVVIEPQFSGINHFKNGLARMETGPDFKQKPVYINPSGNIVWKE